MRDFLESEKRFDAKPLSVETLAERSADAW
jgi:hypothetical protein